MSEIEKLEQKISELRDDILTNPNNKDKKAIILKAIKFLLTKIPEAKRKDKQEEDKRLYTPDEVKEQLSLPIELTNQYKGTKIKPDMLGKKNVWVVVRKNPMLMFKYLDRKKDTFLGNYVRDSNLDILDGKVYVNWNDRNDGVFYDPDTFEKIGYINNKYGNDYLKLILNPLGEKILKKIKSIDGKGINNPDLYEKAKEIVYKQYSKPSAYRSGQLVKKYKEMGGTYSGKKPDDGLTRWYKENWKDIGGKEYPVYRPTKRVSKDTPLTASEIDPIQAINQIKLKQVIKGDANLPKFMGKGIEEFSNPKQVMKNAKKYLGKDVAIELSNKKDKKYMVYNPNIKNWVYFGQIGYEDFTKHKDPKRRENYLKRTANMKGNWKDDMYSPNNLSRNILW